MNASAEQWHRIQQPSICINDLAVAIIAGEKEITFSMEH